jgi:transcriptional regulator with XRE-family HTH domain
MEKLQQKVKALRLKKGWAQEDLARQINVSLSTVQYLAIIFCGKLCYGIG